jgi:hypothetical protein
MENEINNDEVVLNDVPETSEENLEEVGIDTSEGGELIQETVEETKTNSEDDINKLVEERANKMFEEKVKDRLARDRASQERKYNKELAKYKYLESVINAGLGVDNLDEAISKTSSFYKEQGINIPEFKDSYSERDEKVLAKADAQDIIELGRDEMEAEANRLSNIPLDKMTVREKTIFDTLCEELTNLKDIDELKAKGYKTDILETKEFNEFRNQFNYKTPVSKIYEIYKKVNGQAIEQPASPGSAKTTTTNNEIKDYYTPEEVSQFTDQDLDNPKLMKAIEKSMQIWGKSKR